MTLTAAHLNAGVILVVTVSRWVYNLPLPPTSVHPSLISLTVSVDVKHHGRGRTINMLSLLTLVPGAPESRLRTAASAPQLLAAGGTPLAAPLQRSAAPSPGLPPPLPESSAREEFVHSKVEPVCSLHFLQSQCVHAQHWY